MRNDSNWKTLLCALSAAGAWFGADPAFAGDPVPSVPTVVREMANAYIDDDQAIGVSLDREASVVLYARAFFMGFTAPGTSFPGKKGIVPVAMAAGAAFSRDHPEQLDAIMTTYGYVRRSATGVCSSNFEISRFDADDAPLNDFHMKESWWLSGLPAMRSTLPPVPAGARHSSVTRACSVEGYLSPPGGYGHMNMFARDFKATSIAPAEARPASATAP